MASCVFLNFKKNLTLILILNRSDVKTNHIYSFLSWRLNQRIGEKKKKNLSKSVTKNKKTIFQILPLFFSSFFSNSFRLIFSLFFALFNLWNSIVYFPFHKPTVLLLPHPRFEIFLEVLLLLFPASSSASSLHSLPLSRSPPHRSLMFLYHSSPFSHIQLLPLIILINFLLSIHCSSHFLSFIHILLASLHSPFSNTFTFLWI